MLLRAILRLSATLLVIGIVACGTAFSPATPPLATGELALRHKLGIPDDAAKVMLFSQSSHLDINWLLTRMYTPKYARIGV